MKIQKIELLPDRLIGCSSLYWKTDQGMHPKRTAEGLYISKGSVIDFCTLFNCVSIKKWRKYTYIKNIGIELKLHGKIELQVFQIDSSKGKIIENRIMETVVQSDCSLYPETIGQAEILGFKIIALEDTVLTEGAYVSDDRLLNLKKNHVKIALNICTYRNNNRLSYNLKTIKRKVLNCSDNILQSHIEVFVIDNSGNFCPPLIEQDDRIHIIHKDALGSAGGFSAGAKEIMDRREKYGFTHLIFMDDDIHVPISTLERTYLFLALLRPEFNEFILGGAFMQLESPEFQYEAGARWNEGQIKSLKHRLDMRKLDSVVFNEIEEKTDYMGWWYCCVPLICIEKRGYPEKVYFHRDDVEFGLRNPKQMTLNGICVWHLSPEAKPNSAQKYYDIRNMAIVNSLHCDTFSKWKYLKAIWFAVGRDVLRYRYKDARLTLKGACDFCMGRKWIISHDSGALYEQIVSLGYQFEKTDQIDNSFDRSPLDYKTPRIGKRLLMAILLNGLFLPSKRKVIIPAYDPPFDCAWRARYIINFNTVDKNSFFTERSRKDAIEIIWKLMKTSAVVISLYNVAATSWKRESGIKDEK